jgi:diguanylate cyclase (GGDEF)-like protein
VLKQPLTRYVSAVVAAGIGCLVVLIASGGLDLLDAQRPELLVLLVLCAIVAELTPLKVVLRAKEGEITASNTFAFALLILYGPAPAALAFAMGTIVADGIRRRPPERIAFNASQYILTVAGSGLALSALSGLPHLHDPTSLQTSDLLGIVAAAVVFHALNSSFVAGAIALTERIGFWRYLASDLFLQGSTAGLLLGLSPVLVITADFSLLVLPLLFLPLLAIHRGGRQAIAKEHQALHDALTGLPNRVLFRDRIQQAVRAAERRHGGAAVMIMDLDHFKEVNDTLGHHHGDVLLQEVAERLKTTLRTADTVARLGGDEFGILLPDVLGAEDAQAVAGILQTALREPFIVDGLTLEMGGSIGIACHPDHGDHVEVLIQRADIAMYSAKEGGRGFALYEPQQDHYSPRRLSLAGELRSALESEELELHYQPKADVVTGRIVGVEALVRWNHPRHGLLGPEEFVPIAEQTGLIVPLTRWVLGAAIRQVQAWQGQGYELSVAVNLSARSFLDTALAVDIPLLLQRHKIEPKLLELEVTESTIMLDPVRATNTLERLSEIGLRLSIDDFGTGYSSLANLKRLPVDMIKIDKSFVLEMATEHSDAAIVRSTIELAHNLGLQVIAEGVEDRQIWEELARLGCDYAQGYYLSRPLPADKLAPKLGMAPVHEGHAERPPLRLVANG